MLEDAEMKKSVEKSKEWTRKYCDRYKLTNCKFSAVHPAVNKSDRDAIRRKPEGFRSGCYFIYSGTGILLYVGKSSRPEISTGSRINSRFSADWNAEIAFVQIFEVENDYEACSLEDFLIKMLKPKHNKPQEKSRPTGRPGYDQCDYEWLK
jgi:hypothetical protein